MSAQVSTEHSLQVRGVTKQYGDFVAVGDMSFDTPSGVVYGLLGPNGAGKTTTLRMINNIIMPDSGDILLLGKYQPGPEAAKHIGYLPEERGLYPKMKVRETLRFFGTLRGLGNKPALHQADSWLERLKLSDWRDNNVQDLSKGMQQKVQFAAALIHDPELLILDEPWSGLDPINAEVLKDIVAAQKDAGKTILFSTHLMDQAETLCDYVCIMAKGRKAVEGRLDVLKRETAAEGLLHLALATPDDESRARSEVLASPTVDSVRDENDGMVVQLADGESPDKLLAALVAANIGIRRFELQQASLHQIFVDRVGALADADQEGRLADD
ncbi:MAG: ATP-binding cassette domain-containing protein [Myxococcales bacterium]|nr:ATP-binding cassette domain-containing protein [Myxococcales bacterium]